MNNDDIVVKLTKMETTLEDIRRAVSGHDQDLGLTGRVRQLEVEMAIVKNNFKWLAWMAGVIGGVMGSVAPSLVKWVINAI